MKLASASFLLIPVLLFTLQAACNPFAIPSMGPVQAQGHFNKIAMPKGGFRLCFYRKDNSHKIILSQKGEYGPGLMLDLDTSAQEWMADRDLDPGGHMVIPGETQEAWQKRHELYLQSMQQPGETLEAWNERTKIEPIVPDEFFSCARGMSANDPSTRREGCFIELKGKFSKIYGVATEGDLFPTGLRKTEESLFTGDLVLTVKDNVLLKQHFKHMPTLPINRRTHGALDVGLVFYADEHPDGSGDLYIFQVPRHVVEPEPEPQMPMLQFNPSAP